VRGAPSALPACPSAAHTPAPCSTRQLSSSLSHPVGSPACVEPVGGSKARQGGCRCTLFGLGTSCAAHAGAAQLGRWALDVEGVRPPLARCLRGCASPPAGRGDASDTGVPRQPRSGHAARASLSFSSVATGSALTRFCTAGDGACEAGFPKIRLNICSRQTARAAASHGCQAQPHPHKLTAGSHAWCVVAPCSKGFVEERAFLLRRGLKQQTASHRGDAVQRVIPVSPALPRVPPMALPLGVASPLAPSATSPWAWPPARRPRCGICASTGRPHHQPGDDNPPSAAQQPPRLADFAAAFAALMQQAGGGRAPRLPSLSDSAGALCTAGLAALRVWLAPGRGVRTAPVLFSLLTLPTNAPSVSAPATEVLQALAEVMQQQVALAQAQATQLVEGALLEVLLTATGATELPRGLASLSPTLSPVTPVSYRDC
jgi:hypothetical protein